MCFFAEYYVKFIVYVDLHLIYHATVALTDQTPPGRQRAYLHNRNHWRGATVDTVIAERASLHDSALVDQLLDIAEVSLVLFVTDKLPRGKVQMILIIQKLELLHEQIDFQYAKHVFLFRRNRLSFAGSFTKLKMQ